MYVLGKGSTFSWGSDSIAKAISIDGPSESMSEVDVTNLSDTHKVPAPGLYDPGEVTIVIEVDPDETATATMHGDFVAGTQKNWSLTSGVTASGISDSIVNNSHGFIKSFALSGSAQEDKCIYTVTIRSTEPVVPDFSPS